MEKIYNAGLDVMNWINLNKHNWEYAELIHENIIEGVKKFSFCGFVKYASRINIKYIAEGLK